MYAVTVFEFPAGHHRTVFNLGRDENQVCEQGLSAGLGPAMSQVL